MLVVIVDVTDDNYDNDKGRKMKIKSLFFCPRPFSHFSFLFFLVFVFLGIRVFHQRENAQGNDRKWTSKQRVRV